MNSLKKILIAFIIFASIGAYFSTQMIAFFSLLLPAGVILVAFSPTDTFISVATIIIAFAAVLTAPIALLELVRFVSPALYEKEKQGLMKLLPVSIILFIAGASFGIYVMVFIGLQFFAELATSYGVSNMWTLSGLMESIAFIGIAFGVAFQMPIFIVFLVNYGFLKIEHLIPLRPLVFIGILILSAFLTPPDALSMLLMAIPLYGLFEGTLLYLKIFNIKNNKEAAKNAEHRNP